MEFFSLFQVPPVDHPLKRRRSVEQPRVDGVAIEEAFHNDPVVEGHRVVEGFFFQTRDFVHHPFEDVFLG